MKIKATISDYVKVKAFDAMLKAFKSDASYCRRMECIITILEQAESIVKECEEHSNGRQ